MDEHLSPEEISALKELASNLIAMSRVKKLFTTALLWLSGIVGAGFVLYTTASSIWGKH